MATALPYVTKHKLQEADKRPAKKARPSLPAPTSNYQPQLPRSASTTAIASPATYKMPVPGTAAATASAAAGPSGAGLSGGPSRPSSGGEPSGRALAPPFTRAQHLAAQVSPALNGKGGQGGMALGMTYPGHRGTGPAGAPPGSGPRGGPPHPQNLERRAPPAPGMYPNSLTPVILGAGVPQGYLPAAPAPSHHAAYFAAFRPPTYPLPITRPRFPTPPTGILPMWQHFFHQLDPTLMTLAPILASEAVGVTLSGFYNQSERVRRTLLEELQKYGATLYCRAAFADKMEVEGRKVYDGLMEEALKRKEKVAAAANEKEKEREERQKADKARAEERRAVEEAMEVDAAPVAGPSGINGSSNRASSGRNSVAIASAPRSATQPTDDYPASASADVSMVEDSIGPQLTMMAPEASVTPAPEASADEPIIDPSLPDLEIEWVTHPPEMIARMAANGFEYLSIFRKAFLKRRPEDRELTGAELRTFFKGYEIESVLADKMGWHITMGGETEAYKAYRALKGKKKLWGVPLQFDLCAPAGKVGSVQQPPATFEELGSRLRKSLAPAGVTAEDEVKKQGQKARKAERVAAATAAREQRAKAVGSGGVNELAGRSLSQEKAETERMNDPMLPIPEVRYCSSDKALKDELVRNALPYVQIRPRSQRVVSPRDAVPKRVRFAADWIKDELEAVLANYKGWVLTMTEPDAARVLKDYLQDDADYVVTECEAFVAEPATGTPVDEDEAAGPAALIAAGKDAAGKLSVPAAESDGDRDGTPMQISEGESAADAPRAESPAARLPPPPLQPVAPQQTSVTPEDATSASAGQATFNPTPSKAAKLGMVIGPFSILPTKAGTPASAGAWKPSGDWHRTAPRRWRRGSRAWPRARTRTASRATSRASRGSARAGRTRRRRVAVERGTGWGRRTRRRRRTTSGLWWERER